MTAQLHYVGDDRHVLVDETGATALRTLAGRPAGRPRFELTGMTGQLDSIPVYVDRCPCTETTA